MYIARQPPCNLETKNATDVVRNYIWIINLGDRKENDYFLPSIFVVFLELKWPMYFKKHVVVWKWVYFHYEDGIRIFPKSLFTTISGLESVPYSPQYLEGNSRKQKWGSVSDENSHSLWYLLFMGTRRLNIPLAEKRSWVKVSKPIHPSHLHQFFVMLPSRSVQLFL